jgi:hypothetical protein
MSFGWTLLGTIAQLMLAYVLFMLVAFSAGALANGGSLGRLQLAIVNAALFGLPALCVLSAAIVAYLHLHGGGRQSYWWYAMPLAGAALYVAYAMAAGRRM